MREFQSGRNTLSPKNPDFLIQGEVERQMRSGCQNVPKIWIFKFSSSLVSLKSSESDHIAPTWSTHEYYGLRKFQSDWNTLTSKNMDFRLKGEVMRQLRSGGENPPKSRFSGFRVFRMVRKCSYYTHILYPRVLWIAKVSERSKHFNLKNPDFFEVRVFRSLRNFRNP